MGTIDPDTLPKEEAGKDGRATKDRPPSLQGLLNLDDIEELATKRLTPKAWAYYYSAGDDLISKRLNNQVYRSILLRYVYLIFKLFIVIDYSYSYLSNKGLEYSLIVSIVTSRPLSWDARSVCQYSYLQQLWQDWRSMLPPQPPLIHFFYDSGHLIPHALSVPSGKQALLGLVLVLQLSN